MINTTPPASRISGECGGGGGGSGDAWATSSSCSSCSFVTSASVALQQQHQQQSFLGLMNIDSVVHNDHINNSNDHSNSNNHINTIKNIPRRWSTDGPPSRIVNRTNTINSALFAEKVSGAGRGTGSSSSARVDSSSTNTNRFPRSAARADRSPVSSSYCRSTTYAGSAKFDPKRSGGSAASAERSGSSSVVSPDSFSTDHWPERESGVVDRRRRGRQAEEAQEGRP